MKLIALIFFIFPLLTEAQSGYARWISIQKGSEIHLKGKYKKKKIYGSVTGEKSDLKLSQVQEYKNNRLIKDLMYIDYPQLMYNMTINYQEDGTAIGINLEDSSVVTYAFTPAQKLRYYVVEQQNDMHVVYSYDSDGDLIRCKDCLAQFDDHNWCVYYTYSYNAKKQLTGTSSFLLEKGADKASKTLFEADSLVYEKDLLTARWGLILLEKLLKRQLILMITKDY